MLNWETKVTLYEVRGIADDTCFHKSMVVFLGIWVGHRYRLGALISDSHTFANRLTSKAYSKRRHWIFAANQIRKILHIYSQTTS